MADETATQTTQTQPQAQPQTQTQQEEPKYKVKVDGVEKEVSLSELLAAYSKATAADQRFQEAAKLRQEAEAKIKIADALQEFMVNPSPEKLKQLAILNGHPIEEAEKMVKQIEAQLKMLQQGQQGNLAGSGEGSDEAFFVGEEDLDPRVREQLNKVKELEKKLQEQENQKFWNNVYSEIENDIDNHPILGKLNEEQRSVLKDFAKQSAVVEVGVWRRDWTDVRPLLLDGVVEYARKLGLDVSNQSPNQPSSEGGGEQSAPPPPATAVGPGATLPATTSETSKPQQGEKPVFGTRSYFDRLREFARMALRKPTQ